MLLITLLVCSLFVISGCDGQQVIWSSSQTDMVKSGVISDLTDSDGHDQNNRSDQLHYSQRNQNNQSHTIEIELISFTTDKSSYSSYETITTSIMLYSKSDLEDVSLKLYGIQPYNHNYIDLEKMTALNAGTNEFEFAPRAPSCTSGCGGVHPGSYLLFFEAYHDNNLLMKANMTIDLIRG